jgi:hypothetical protein
MAARGPKSDKICADAVHRAVKRRLETEEGKPQKIERLADNLVNLGLEGDMAALREIGDRLDGKAPMGIQHSGDPDNPITLIERRIVGEKVND